MTLQQFYIGATGMESFQTDLMNITNNVSNAQTVGFKSSRVEYENLFPQILDQVENQVQAYYDEKYNNGNNANQEIGSGVKISGVTKDFKQGSIQVTGKQLDLAIEGDGFFQFRLIDGTTVYSRAGNLRKNTEGYLTDPNGHLLDPAINIPNNVTNLTIDAEGKVYNSSDKTELGQITLATFSNPSELKAIGQNLFLKTVGSGEAIVSIPSHDNVGAIAQGSLEFSNVDVVSEMMRMVITQRAFEVVSKMVQSGESMLRSATDIARS